MTWRVGPFAYVNAYMVDEDLPEPVKFHALRLGPLVIMFSPSLQLMRLPNEKE